MRKVLFLLISITGLFILSFYFSPRTYAACQLTSCDACSCSSAGCNGTQTCHYSDPQFGACSDMTQTCNPGAAANNTCSGSSTDPNKDHVPAVCNSYQKVECTQGSTCSGLNSQSCGTCQTDQSTTCYQDIKTCPDGTQLARDPNNSCQFPACPSNPTPPPSNFSCRIGTTNTVDQSFCNNSGNYCVIFPVSYSGQSGTVTQNWNFSNGTDTNSSSQTTYRNYTKGTNTQNYNITLSATNNGHTATCTYSIQVPGTGSSTNPPPNNPPPGTPTQCGAGEHLVGPANSCSSVSQCSSPYNWCNAGACYYCAPDSNPPPNNPPPPAQTCISAGSRGCTTTADCCQSNGIECINGTCTTGGNAPPPPGSNSTITGTVFIDDGAGGGIANDGIRNGGEKPYLGTGGSGAKLTYTAAFPPPAVNKTTNSSISNGMYTFSRISGASGNGRTFAYPAVQLTIPTGFKLSTGSTNPIQFKTVIDGSSTYPNNDFGIVSTAPPPPAQSTVSGFLYQGGTQCSSTAPLANATVTLTSSSGSTVGSVTTDATGKYTFTIPNASGYTLSFNDPGGAALQYVNAGSCVAKTGPYTFNLTGAQSINFYLNNTFPWFQTNLGDVRFGSIFNKVPAGLFASTDPNNPSVFYSINSVPNFGMGEASSKAWSIGNEYSYNNSSTSRNGSSAYTFYKTRAQETGVKIQPIDNISRATDTGVYDLSSGSISSSYTVPAGKHIVILVDGDLIISGTTMKITVPQGSLFVIAAKGNITIDPTVGTTASDTSSALQGIYTSEKNIILASDSSCPTTPDKRLNIAGVLVANALRPFDSDGSGKVVNQRTLCSNDGTYPSLFVSSRLDFVTQLTQFYKTTYQKWEEVQP